MHRKGRGSNLELLFKNGRCISAHELVIGGLGMNQPRQKTAHARGPARQETRDKMFSDWLHSDSFTHDIFEIRLDSPASGRSFLVAPKPKGNSKK
jgi:hypothetical protein